MPRISQPYYNLHQILTGQYSDGGELVLGDGNIYIGAYHVLPNGQKFSEFQPTQKSVELFELRLTPTADVLTYNKITGKTSNKYLVPIGYQPNPTLEDYKVGRIERFFLQKRNSPLNTIMEIDVTQFNSINTTNKAGINGVLWNSLKVNWIISKIPKDDASYLNSQQIVKATPTFPYLSLFLTNTLEFYR